MSPIEFAFLPPLRPFLYPKDASDFRKQFCVGDYVKNKKDHGEFGPFLFTVRTCMVATAIPNSLKQGSFPRSSV